MSSPIGKILMAYRPLYLRGLLMDGQYRLPANMPPSAGKRAETETTAIERRPSAACKPLQGATR
ncbi:hypothetical protein [Dyella sedimenti]|uniref:hypothetical protein n=1 Tax=Dyella sedimenti TaxID=2919947 RepID=UPI001FAA8A6B|nr:hypothetical protein [Dyella sedimenti]